MNRAWNTFQFKVMKKFRVMRFANQEKYLTRYGTSYGGWFLPSGESLSSNDVVVTAGAGEDISFEVTLAHKFPCRVVIADPTPKAIRHFENLCKT